jgi:hypothetical protein
MKNLARFITLLFAVITLSALLSHLLELPGKLELTKENYQAVQSIYGDWILMIFFEGVALVLTVYLAIIERRKRRTRNLLIAASSLFFISIVVFFIFIAPVDKATENWSVLPADWETLRNQWEYSYAGRALLNLGGFCFLVFGVLKKKSQFSFA